MVGYCKWQWKWPVVFMVINLMQQILNQVKLSSSSYLSWVWPSLSWPALSWSTEWIQSPPLVWYSDYWVTASSTDNIIISYQQDNVISSQVGGLPGYGGWWYICLKINGNNLETISFKDWHCRMQSNSFSEMMSKKSIPIKFKKKPWIMSNFSRKNTCNI